MTPAPTPPPPGSMTVPPLFGWDDVALVLAVVLALAVVAVSAMAAGRARAGRSEFEAWLAGRSAPDRDQGLR